MKQERVEAIKKEVKKAIVGKGDVVEKVMTAILAGGHILLEDIPGVGKTTLALAFSKAMGLTFNRVQFTPDVVPSDITGFSMYDKQTGAFRYQPGAALCHFLLADEINRTSSKTQSALLEVMQEGKITVDGASHAVPSPFIVMATQNPLGTAGTQMLPEAQLDRFMIQLSIGYPDLKTQVTILRDREKDDPLAHIACVAAAEDIEKLKQEVKSVFVDEKICTYIALLAEGTRAHDVVRLGLSPRGALALFGMARAKAYVEGRTYVIPEDVKDVFPDVCRHRVLLKPKAQLSQQTVDAVLAEVLSGVTAPTMSGTGARQA